MHWYQSTINIIVIAFALFTAGEFISNVFSNYFYGEYVNETLPDKTVSIRC